MIFLGRAIALVVTLLVTSCGTDERQSDGGQGTGGSAQNGTGGMHGGGAGHDRVTQMDAATVAPGGGALDSGTGGHASHAMDASVMDARTTARDANGGNPLADADVGDAAIEPSPCLEGIGNYIDPGPFQFDTASAGKMNVVKLWIPRVPPGCKVPVVHFGNGTGAACDSYRGILEHLASHGFLVSCYETPAPDDGTHCMTALQTVFDAYPDLASMKIGSAGQEVGGPVALACLRQAEREWGGAARYAGHAIAPAAGTGGTPNWMTVFAEVRSPVFMFNGSEDGLVSAGWVQDSYDALHTEKYWYEATGAPHIPIPVSWGGESAVVFFRWKLLGDEVAGDYFAAMPDSDRWDLQMQDPDP